MFILGIVLLVIGGILLYTAFERYSKGRKLNQEARQIIKPGSDALGGGIPAVIMVAVGL